MAYYNISGLPEDLPPGEYDITLDNVRYEITRDGWTVMIFETTFRGSRNDDDPTLLHFTKEAAKEA